MHILQIFNYRKGRYSDNYCNYIDALLISRYIDILPSTSSNNVMKLYIHVFYLLQLGDNSDSVTIVIVSVPIMIVITKNYYCDSGHMVTSMCI